MSSIVLKNAHLEVIIDPDHGAEIVHLSFASGANAGVNVLSAPQWTTPLPASRSRTYGNDVLDWLSEYRGGWQELFPNAGGSGIVLGVPLPFHGEVSRAQWDWQWLEEGQAVRLRCPARLPLVLERTMRLAADRPSLVLEERITSEATFSVPYIWGHHPAFGSGIAVAGAYIDLPAGKLTADSGLDGPTVDLTPGSEHSWPHATSRNGQPVNLSVIPDVPLERLLYVHELQEGWYALRNPQTRLGVAIAWDLNVFPCLWLWQEIRGGQGMPWYGRGDITALEPMTQWPSYGLEEAIKHGQARTLEAGQTVSTTLACTLFEASNRAVTGVPLDGIVQIAK
jgi:hypothetical protein